MPAEQNLHLQKGQWHLPSLQHRRRFVSTAIFQGQTGTQFQQKFPFFWGFIIDVTMVPIFSSSLKSKEHCCVQIKGIFQSQTHSTKGHWLFSYLVFIYSICGGTRPHLYYKALKSAALKAQLVNRPFLI